MSQNFHFVSHQMRMTLGQADGLENVVLEPAAGDPRKLLETRRSVTVTQDLGFVRFIWVSFSFQTQTRQTKILVPLVHYFSPVFIKYIRSKFLLFNTCCRKG